MIRFTPFPHWTREFLDVGAFNDIETLFSLREIESWPSLESLNNAFSQQSHGESALRFVDNDEIEENQGYYEEIIYKSGRIPTRRENWHDLFGAYIWKLFPKTKALLNALHMQEIAEHGLTHRSRCRNALTLFDECGVVMAVSDDTWVDAFREHKWEEVFIARKEDWGNSIRPYIFGHANYEMLTRPYLGLTGKALFIKVNNEIFCKDLASQYDYLDGELCSMIQREGLLQDNKAMSPLPLLGVPGWYDENQDPAFYNNRDYFRAKRRK